VGSYIEGAYIDFTSESWTRPRVASNLHASQFLVVAETGPAGGQAIRGRTREAGSTDMGTPFLISTGSGVDIRPDVGGDPFPGQDAYYLVVWEHEFMPGDHDIYARLVDTSGSTHGNILLIDVSTAHELAPAVSNSNGTREWTIAYEREDTPSDHDIRAAQVFWDGTISTPNFSVNSSAADDRSPSVSSGLDGLVGPRPYVVAFVRDHGNDRDIVGRALAGANALSVTTNLTVLLGTTSFLDQNLPAIDSDGSTFILANSQQEPGSTNNNIVVGAMTLADGQLLRAEPTTTWAGEIGQNETSVAIYTQRSGGGPTETVRGVWSKSADIEGGRYRSPGPGDVFCTSLPHSGGVRARLAASGSISIARNAFILSVTDAPPNKPGLFFYGLNQVNQPFGEGRRCAGGAVDRIQPFATTDSTGSIVRPLDFDLPYGSAITSGPPGVNFQYWFRDPAGGPSGFNLSDGLHVEFQP